MLHNEMALNEKMLFLDLLYIVVGEADHEINIYKML